MAHKDTVFLFQEETVLLLWTIYSSELIHIWCSSEYLGQQDEQDVCSIESEYTQCGLFISPVSLSLLSAHNWKTHIFGQNLNTNNEPSCRPLHRQTSKSSLNWWEWYSLYKNCCMSNDITLSGFIIKYGGSIIFVACIHKLISASAPDSYYSFKNQHIQSFFSIMAAPVD